jgi:hypothetical protein
MKLYQTSYTLRNTHTNEPYSMFAWHGSAADASKARSAAKAEDRNSKPSTEVIEVATNKEGLLRFLNFARVDARSPL